MRRSLAGREDAFSDRHARRKPPRRARRVRWPGRWIVVSPVSMSSCSPLFAETDQAASNIGGSSRRATTSESEEGNQDRQHTWKYREGPVPSGNHRATAAGNHSKGTTNGLSFCVVAEPA